MRAHLILVVSILVAGLAASGCYAPDLRDCTVTCSGPDDCAGDQVCNGAGLCAAEGATCQGSGGVAPDAAPAMITLRVQVSGTGKVVVEGVGECEGGDCMWQVARAVIRFRAQETDDEKSFERWTTQNCGGPQMTQTTCTFTPSSSTTVGAKFE